MSAIISRFINRLRFRKSLNKDESINVIDGMVKAKLLYKKLSVAAHPDKHPDNLAIAEDIMARISANRYNYSELILLEKEVIEKLNSHA